MSTLYLLELGCDNYQQWQALLPVLLEWVDSLQVRVDPRRAAQQREIAPFSSDLVAQEQIGHYRLIRLWLSAAVRDYLLAKPQLYGWSFESPEHPAFLDGDRLLCWTNSYTPMVFLDLTAEQAERLRQLQIGIEPLASDVARESTLRHLWT